MNARSSDFVCFPIWKALNVLFPNTLQICTLQISMSWKLFLKSNINISFFLHHQAGKIRWDRLQCVSNTPNNIQSQIADYQYIKPNSQLPHSLYFDLLASKPVSKLLIKRVNNGNMTLRQIHKKNV